MPTRRLAVNLRKMRQRWDRQPAFQIFTQINTPTQRSWAIEMAFVSRGQSLPRCVACSGGIIGPRAESTLWRVVCPGDVCGKLVTVRRLDQCSPPRICETKSIERSMRIGRAHGRTGGVPCCQFGQTVTVMLMSCPWVSMAWW